MAFATGPASQLRPSSICGRLPDPVRAHAESEPGPPGVPFLRGDLYRQPVLPCPQMSSSLRAEHANKRDGGRDYYQSSSLLPEIFDDYFCTSRPGIPALNRPGKQIQRKTYGHQVKVSSQVSGRRRLNDYVRG